MKRSAFKRKFVKSFIIERLDEKRARIQVLQALSSSNLAEKQRQQYALEFENIQGSISELVYLLNIL